MCLRIFCRTSVPSQAAVMSYASFRRVMHGLSTNCRSTALAWSGHALSAHWSAPVQQLGPLIFERPTTERSQHYRIHRQRMRHAGRDLNSSKKEGVVYAMTSWGRRETSKRMWESTWRKLRSWPCQRSLRKALMSFLTQMTRPQGSLDSHKENNFHQIQKMSA